VQTLIYFAFAILAGACLLSFLHRQDVVVTFLAVSAVSAVLLARQIINPTSLSALRRPNRQTWAWRPFRIAEATNYDSIGPQAPNLLVIRGVDDEAALVLAAGSIATAISRFVLSMLWKCLNAVLGFVFLFAFLVRQWRGGDITSIDRWALLGFVVLWVGTCICLLIPGLFKSPFGREFLLGASRCEIVTESTPDTVRARIVTLHTPHQELNIDWVEALLVWCHRLRGTSTSKALSPRHSLYNNPDCVPEIVKWLNAHFDSCPNDAS